jgi:hypothetical protein
VEVNGRQISQQQMRQLLSSMLWEVRRGSKYHVFFIALMYLINAFFFCFMLLDIKKGEELLYDYELYDNNWGVFGL